jgi:hypothetical protein
VLNYPIENFFSALATVCRRIFSALSVNVHAWIKEIPNAFGTGVEGELGEGIDGVDRCEEGFEWIKSGGGWCKANLDCCKGGLDGCCEGVDGGGGLAFLACGETGRLDNLVLEKGALEKTDVVDPVSEPVGEGEDLPSVLENVDEALLKNALAGDELREGTSRCGVFGDSANGIPGMLMSLRTTMRERCKRFCASLFET